MKSVLLVKSGRVMGEVFGISIIKFSRDWNNCVVILEEKDFVRFSSGKPDLYRVHFSACVRLRTNDYWYY